MSVSRNIYRKRGTGTYRDGYKLFSVGGKQIPEHVLIAEAAIGKKLPVGAVVHHINGDRRDNTKSNLLVCPDQNYHMMIHRRQRAYEACGHADYVKCPFCKTYGPRESMRRYSPNKDVYRHSKCIVAYNRKYQTAACHA